MTPTPETLTLIKSAREATKRLRDAARQVMGHRERDPLVLGIHAALDRLETCDRYLTAERARADRAEDRARELRSELESANSRALSNQALCEDAADRAERAEQARDAALAALALIETGLLTLRAQLPTP